MVRVPSNDEIRYTAAILGPFHSEAYDHSRQLPEMTPAQLISGAQTNAFIDLADRMAIAFMPLHRRIWAKLRRMVRRLTHRF